MIKIGVIFSISWGIILFLFLFMLILMLWINCIKHYKKKIFIKRSMLTFTENLFFTQNNILFLSLIYISDARMEIIWILKSVVFLTFFCSQLIDVFFYIKCVFKSNYVYSKKKIKNFFDSLMDEKSSLKMNVFLKSAIFKTSSNLHSKNLHQQKKKSSSRWLNGSKPITKINYVDMKKKKITNSNNSSESKLVSNVESKSVLNLSNLNSNSYEELKNSNGSTTSSGNSSSSASTSSALNEDSLKGKQISSSKIKDEDDLKTKKEYDEKIKKIKCVKKNPNSNHSGRIIIIDNNNVKRVGHKFKKKHKSQNKISEIEKINNEELKTKVNKYVINVFKKILSRSSVICIVSILQLLILFSWLIISASLILHYDGIKFSLDYKLIILNKTVNKASINHSWPSYLLLFESIFASSIFISLLLTKISLNFFIKSFNNCKNIKNFLYFSLLILITSTVFVFDLSNYLWKLLEINIPFSILFILLINYMEIMKEALSITILFFKGETIIAPDIIEEILTKKSLFLEFWKYASDEFNTDQILFIKNSENLLKIRHHNKVVERQLRLSKLDIICNLHLDSNSLYGLNISGNNRKHADNILNYVKYFKILNDLSRNGRNDNHKYNPRSEKKSARSIRYKSNKLNSEPSFPEYDIRALIVLCKRDICDLVARFTDTIIYRTIKEKIQFETKI